MGYYDSQEAIVTVTQHWHVRVAARRYFNQAIAEIKERLQPEHKCFWKASGSKFNGYQADLASFAIDSALDSTSSGMYPDWQLAFRLMTPSFESRVLSLAGYCQAARLMPLFASAVNCLKDKEAAIAYGYLMGRSDAENKAPMPKPYIDQQIEDILVNTDVSTD